MSGKQYEPTYEGQLDKCQDERHALQMQLEEYIEAFQFARKEFHEALDDLAKMKEERDEARRMVCEWHGGLRVQHPQDYAKRRGWDCFGQEAPPSPVVKTLKGVIRDGGKAVPPKFELEEDEI